MDSGPTLIQDDHILTWLTSAKTLLPNKLTFIGSKFIMNWGHSNGHYN